MRASIDTGIKSNLGESGGAKVSAGERIVLGVRVKVITRTYTDTVAKSATKDYIYPSNSLNYFI